MLTAVALTINWQIASVVLVFLVLVVSIYGAFQSQGAKEAAENQLQRSDVDVHVGFEGADGSFQLEPRIQQGGTLAVILTNLGSTESPPGRVTLTFLPPGQKLTPGSEWEEAPPAPIGSHTVAYEASFDSVALHEEEKVGSFAIPDEDFTQIPVYWAVHFEDFSGNANQVTLKRLR